MSYPTRYPIHQYFSPSMRETLNVFSDDDPPQEDQIKWVSEHPDAILLRALDFSS